MELQKAKHELMVEQWRRRVYECRNSGQTIRSWCQENHVCQQTYFRWQHIVWDNATQKIKETSKTEEMARASNNITFAEYPVLATPAEQTPTAAITLHLKYGTVEIPNGADPETVASVLRAVRALC